MNQNTFNIAVELGSLYNKYADLSERTTDEIIKKVYEEAADHFAELHSKLLEIGRFVNEDKMIGDTTSVLKSYGNLKSHTQVYVYYKYDNGLALVEDTAMEEHLVPQSILK
jgi:hypothetical protein